MSNSANIAAKSGSLDGFALLRALTDLGLGHAIA